jgi:hypothetical protein
VVAWGKVAVAAHDKEDAASAAWDEEASAAGVKDYYLMLTKK